MWTRLALRAADQLRQRMAWGLSQIVAVGLPGSGMVFNEETEHYLAFYDMFVNHAFGKFTQTALVLRSFTVIVTSKETHISLAFSRVFQGITWI